MDNELKSPIIIKYQNLYKEDPKSRVFAPLAEAYRKFGMIDEAIDILKKGIKFHPDFVLAYLGLSFCYFEKNEFNMAYETIRPLVDNNKENLRLQKLYADCCFELKKYEESLNTLKVILFMNPRDVEVSNKIKEIEGSFYKDKALEEEYINEAISPTEKFSVDSLENLNEDNVDNWVKVDLPKSEEVKTSEPSEWEVQKLDEIELNETEETLAPEEEVSSPVSHTLVNLYLEQGYHNKAIEVLEKIVELNPADDHSSRRLSELKNINEIIETSEVEVSSTNHQATIIPLKADDSHTKRIDALIRFKNAIITRKSEKSTY